MFAAAVIVVGAASAAMVAAVRKAADRIVEAVERVEHAVYHYSDAVSAAERRQDKSAGVRSDVARHIVQAVVQYDRAQSALWLQRRLQSAMESAVRGALLVGAERQLYWRMQVFEQSCRSFGICCRTLQMMHAGMELRTLELCSKVQCSCLQAAFIDDGCRVAGPAE